MIIALVTTVLSTIIGTLGAIGMYKYKFKGKGIIDGLLYIPVVIPEIVMGISLLTVFAKVSIPRGMLTLIIAHITFCVPYVIFNVTPKLKQLDIKLYEAALDLGASAGLALRKVVIPQLIPGIVSGFMLSVTLSLDDYFITTYTKPSTFDTISTYVVNATKGSHTEIKTALWALSTLIFVVIVAGVLAWNLLADRKAGAENER